MRVFISWSGEISKRVATALHAWLPMVVQRIEPFLSCADIDKGTMGFERITDELAKADAGIFCLTRDNMRQPWINFEAGAIAKHKDKSRVCTYLFQFDYAEVDGPLKLFQHSRANREETLEMLSSLCRREEPPLLEQARLEGMFNLAWDSLQQKLITADKDLPDPEVPHRTNDEKLDELLAIARSQLDQNAAIAREIAREARSVRLNRSTRSVYNPNHQVRYRGVRMVGEVPRPENMDAVSLKMVETLRRDPDLARRLIEAMNRTQFECGPDDVITRSDS